MATRNDNVVAVRRERVKNGEAGDHSTYKSRDLFLIIPSSNVILVDGSHYGALLLNSLVTKSTKSAHEP